MKQPSATHRGPRRAASATQKTQTARTALEEAARKANKLHHINEDMQAWCAASDLDEATTPLYSCSMSVQEIEAAVRRLSPGELQAFSTWFDEFQAELWDQQFEADVKSGKLDKIGKEVDKRFEKGLSKPL